ncbi:hypothetical protein P3X46_034014 [Hevea brasiliensis]|uniref:Glycosyltransferase n=1 Tax=Hevea brasiliensis TaxID=3981 RepID=A0ABQ9KBG1_HEVBR|nr:anthocyanidin 3-O-glucosyltransferase 6 [Hevea brasiliensis]KAJ9132220.1 hypothetical protein P3X46_034014 [Hevea brasiliensis]
MKKAELVFVPTPGMGHLASTLEAAKLLLDRHHRLSITVLIIKRSSDTLVSSFVNSIAKSDRIQFIELPNVDEGSLGFGFIDKQIPHVKEAVFKLTARPDLSLAGFVLDMFCTSIMDVAKEFGVPSYIFFTSGASFFGFMLYMQLIHDEQEVDPTQFKDSDGELPVPSLANPLPPRVLPSVVLVKEWLFFFLHYARRYREAKGIMVNTFMELESYALNSLGDANSNIPPIYPVGPILSLEGDSHSHNVGPDGSKIMEWLDDQPPSSVVFLCFGSMGGFEMNQAKEIACALEQSGHRFLWSLRRPPPKGKIELSADYQNFQEILPEGFLDRTAGIGKVIGWAPQVAILAHAAIGGFVSHCGWNSILESIWFGVPIATWPMYAEQQFNAFLMVTELGLGVEIKMDYRRESEIIVSAQDIERGIRCVMEHDSEIRKRVKEMSENSKKALKDDGSSYFCVNRLIEDVMDNLP